DVFGTADSGIGNGQPTIGSRVEDLSGSLVDAVISDDQDAVVRQKGRGRLNSRSVHVAHQRPGLRGWIVDFGGREVTGGRRVSGVSPPTDENAVVSEQDCGMP